MSENRRGNFFDSHCRCRPGDADPCPANGFAAFRHPSVAPDPSLSADRHVPDTGGEPFANLFGLWQQRTGWPPGLFGPTTPVSAERGCAVDLGLSPAAIRRHLQRARLPPLAACPRENRVQDRPIDLQSRPRNGIAPGYLGPFTCVADLPSRRSLRSVGTNRLVVPISRLSTVGSRAFPVAGPQTGMTSLKT